MTHLFHASAFSEDYWPTDQSLLTNTYTDIDGGEHINLHVNTGCVRQG